MLAHPINQSADDHHQMTTIRTVTSVSVPGIFIRFLGKRQQFEEIKETKEMSIKLLEFCQIDSVVIHPLDEKTDLPL